jgi:uncharacterized membrane protein
MNKKQVSLVLLIFGIIFMIIGIILMFYYVERKEVKITEIKDNEIKIEYQTKIRNPFWIEGIHFFSLGLTLSIIIFIQSKYEISKRKK